MRSFCLALLMAIGSPLLAQQGWDSRQQGYVVNGQQHPHMCSCTTCVTVRNQNKPAEPTPTTKAVEKPKSVTPPVPKDDEKLAVKTDTDRTPVIPIPALSKDAIIKQIQDNPNLPPDVKRDVIAGMLGQPLPPTTEPSQPAFDLVNIAKIPFITQPRPIEIKPIAVAPKPRAVVENKSFDLIDILNKKVSDPAVKADTDDTQPPFKPATPPSTAKTTNQLPLNIDDDKYEIPETAIGVTVGAKINYNESWDITKPVEHGKLIQFWVKPSTKRPATLKSVAYTWTVLPKEEPIIWPDTTRIILATPSKDQVYIVLLTASYVYVDGDKIIQRTAQAVSTLSVGFGLKPGGSAPAIPTPAGLQGISKLAFEWTANISRGDNYPETKFKADAKKLAASFAKVAKSIDDGTLTVINDVYAKIREENNLALGDAQADWMPWFSKMSEFLKASYADSSIKTILQYKMALNDIAKGLEAIGNQ